jgi:hypothetical protein
MKIRKIGLCVLLVAIIATGIVTMSVHLSADPIDDWLKCQDRCMGAPTPAELYKCQMNCGNPFVN